MGTDATFLAIVRRSYKSQGAVDAAEARACNAYVINGILDAELHANKVSADTWNGGSNADQ